jgi:hypothetical protein
MQEHAMRERLGCQVLVADTDRALSASVSSRSLSIAAISTCISK